MDDTMKKRNLIISTQLLAIGSLVLLTACGGGDASGVGVADPGGTSPQPPPAADLPEASAPEEDPAPDQPDAATLWPLTLRDYVGSLYQTFSWSGPLRDPLRDAVEIHDPNDYQSLGEADKAALQELLQSRHIIMQIGGMGSAKLNHDDPDSPNEKFSRYMNAFLADGGRLWRDTVRQRAIEVAEITPDDATLYWQVGNEIDAASYLTNIRLYFGDDSAEIIPVYVEYFLAPIR